MTWLQPLAWWGLATVAIPILIHWLLRERSLRLLFPSLRFLQTTRVAALRRRAISDVPLLIVRVLVLASAVAALAGPMITTAARRRAWDARVVRAVIVASTPASGEHEAAIEGVAQQERAGSVASHTFVAGEDASGSIRDALIWLEQQRPARREIVVVGALRRGLLRARDLETVPEHVGIRFTAVSGSRPQSLQLTSIADANDNTPHLQTFDVRLDESRTRTTVNQDALPIPDVLKVNAGVEQPYAEAARTAVLAEGIGVSSEPERRVTVLFRGARDEEKRGLIQPATARWMREALAQLPEWGGGERQGRLVVMTDLPATDPAAVIHLGRIARVAFRERRDRFEPIVIDSETLRAWMRAPGPVPLDVTPREEGDRRWLWGIALALLGVEHGLRRPHGSQRAAGSPTDMDGSEARVA